MVGRCQYRLSRTTGCRPERVPNVRYFGDAYYDDPNVVLLPDRTLVNTGFQYQGQLGGRRAVITASINNLFNKKYWDLNTLGEGTNGALSLQVYW